MNVVMTDWLKGSVNWYRQCAANARVVGAYLAYLIKTVQEVGKYSPHRFHLVGVSLGGHACGYAGSIMNGSVGRITGMYNTVYITYLKYKLPIRFMK